MSSVYSLEPPTRGKVVLKTSLGSLDIELFSKEAPKACRNFVQLCLEGYYDKTVFHRLVKDFILQGGDPTGTGEGGESIYGAPFEDEFHSRLQFRRRALVACANQADQRDSNGSQFFITLGRCDWLTKKNTIFGSVAGDTVYNLMKFNDLEVGEGDRPEDPPQVVSAEVVWNPFDDIVPRSARGEGQDGPAQEKLRDDRGRVRNKNLLSFGADEEYADDDEDEAGAGFPLAKIRRPRGEAATPRVDQEPRERGIPGDGDDEAPGVARGEPKAAKGDNSSASLAERMMMRAMAARREAGGAEAGASAEAAASAADADQEAGDQAKVKRGPSLRKALNARLAGPPQDRRKRRRGLAGREEETLAKLERFTSGLRGKGRSAGAGEAEGGEVGPREDIPAAWRVDDYLDCDEDDDTDLRSHVLRFKKEEELGPMTRRDDVDDYVVEDPLLQSAKAKGRGKGKGGGEHRQGHHRRHHHGERRKRSRAGR